MDIQVHNMCLPRRKHWQTLLENHENHTQNEDLKVFFARQGLTQNYQVRDLKNQVLGGLFQLHYSI